MVSLAFSEWLNRELESRGLRTRQLAAHLDVNYSSAGHWLRGQRLPSEENCMKIASYFKVDPEHVLELAGYRKTRQSGD